MPPGPTHADPSIYSEIEADSHFGWDPPHAQDKPATSLRVIVQKHAPIGLVAALAYACFSKPMPTTDYARMVAVCMAAIGVAIVLDRYANRSAAS